MVEFILNLLTVIKLIDSVIVLGFDLKERNWKQAGITVFTCFIVVSLLITVKSLWLNYQ